MQRLKPKPPVDSGKAIITSRAPCIHKWVYIGPRESYSHETYVFYCEKCCKIIKKWKRKFIKSEYSPVNYSNGVDD